MDSIPSPVFFYGAYDGFSAEERIKRKRRELAEIIRWKYRCLKLDAIKPSGTLEAFQVRCLNKRLVHLEHEKVEREQEQKISNASVYYREGQSSRRQILHLLDEVATYEAKIAAVKTDMSELESQIIRATVELKNASKAVTSDFTYAEELQRARKQLSAMENRLHTARTLEGKLHAENKKLRWSIEDMLRERKCYNQLWLVHVQQLGRNRKFLMDMTERATLAFNQGEDLCYRVEALESRQQREKRSRVQEMVELDRQIVGTRKVNEFLQKKGYQRPQAALDRMLVRKRDLFKREQREQIHNCSTIVAQTKECLNLEEIQHVLIEIEKQQEKYMALFRYINLTNDKIEEANEVSHNLEKDIQCLQETARRERVVDARNRKRDGHRVQDYQEQTATMQKELDSQHGNLELKLATVEHALSLVGYDRSKIVQLMAKGSNSSERSQLTENSLKTILAHIEHKVLDMVQMVFAVDVEEEDDTAFGSLYASQQCAECAEGQDVNQHDERIVAPLQYNKLLENVHQRSAASEILYRLHTLSRCKLPRCRMLVNKRY